MLWGDIGIYPTQRWVPPETGRPKPSLKGKKEVSRGKGEAGKPESTENVVVGVVRSTSILAQLSLGSCGVTTTIPLDIDEHVL